MRKITLALFTLVLLAGAGCAATGPIKVEKKVGSAMMAKAGVGTYEDYVASKLAQASGGKVVLFFKANWCPTCRGVDADITANAGAIPEGIHILKINYDASDALKAKYGVTYQHTFVQVDASGNLIKKWSGSPTLAEIIRQII